MGRKIVILLGNPGAGKGTQAKEIMRRLKIPQISTGDMLRDAIAREDFVRQGSQGRMDAGELVSDAIVNGIVAERIPRKIAEWVSYWMDTRERFHRRKRSTST